MLLAALQATAAQQHHHKQQRPSLAGLFAAHNRCSREQLLASPQFCGPMAISDVPMSLTAALPIFQAHAQDGWARLVCAVQ